MIIYSADYTVNDIVKGQNKVQRYYVKRTKAEKKARRAQHAARKVVEVHAHLEQRAVDVIDNLRREVELGRQVQEAFRAHIFGAMLARAMGNEELFSDALLKAFPEWFKGHEEAPWMALSQSS